MALPLKSGADLYNNQALRLRLHNLGADPTEVGAGLIYFNTSTGLNTSQKVRLYTGSAWKTIAFSEDLDVAKNEDFLALKDRVDLLSGDVDTDAIISNMKEVSAFLEGFAEDASLMDYLNTELGKKLDLTGGTIDGNLQIGKSDNVGWKAINFVRNGVTGFIGNAVTKLEVGMSDGYLQIGKDVLTFNNNGTYRPLLHEGNYSDYALPLSGGTMTGDISTKSFSSGTDSLGLYIEGRSTVGVRIQYDKSGKGNYDQLLLKNGVISWNNKPLLHSGNVGEYNAGSATKLATPRTIWGQSFDGTGNVSGDLHLNQSDIYWNYDKANYCIESVTPTDASPYLKIAHYGGIAFHTVGAQKMLINTSGNVTIGASDLAGSNSKLFVDGHMATSNNKALYGKDTSGILRQLLVLDNGNDFILGYGASEGGLNTYIDGSEIYLRYGTSHKKGFTLNSSGNVLIGTTEDNGAKLQVNGTTASALSLFRNNAGAGIFMDFFANADKSKYWRIGHAANNSFSVFYNDGVENVLFKLSKDSGVEINGDLHVTGNIIADGEVSAGGAAEEGSTSGSGAGAFHSESIGVGATQTTIAHGLGTDDIVVSIYEKDGVSGRWSIILTDVEIVDANNIIVSFGSATSVEHKVVIMGAVA